MLQEVKWIKYYQLKKIMWDNEILHSPMCLDPWDSTCIGMNHYQEHKVPIYRIIPLSKFGNNLVLPNLNIVLSLLP